MKKIFILAAVCFVLIFSGCSDRSGANVPNSGSQSEDPHSGQEAADSSQTDEFEYSSERSDQTAESSREDIVIKEPENAEEKIKQIIDADSGPLKIINRENSPFTLSLEITASGNVSRSLKAGRSGYAAVIQSDNQIGEAIELRYDGGEIEEVVLHFRIADEYVDNELNLYPDYEELHGVKRFNIFKYFEEINMLLPIETTVDIQTNTISSTVDELGTYCVIDMEKWFKTIEEFSGLQN